MNSLGLIFFNFRYFMNPLDITILSKLGKQKYLSVSYLKHTIPTSNSNLAKRLKFLFDKKLIGRTIQLEPILQREEFFYYLRSHGSKKLLQYSLDFISEDDFDIPKGSHSFATHDAAIAWVNYFFQTDSNHYNKHLIHKIELEALRAKIYRLFCNEKFLPDSVIKIWLHDIKMPKIFLVEVDNSTESKKIIREKLNTYKNFLAANKNAYLIFIVIKASPMRLALIMKQACLVINQKNCVFGVLLSDLNKFDVFSNLYMKPEHLYKIQYYNGIKKAVRNQTNAENLRFPPPI